MIVKCDQCGNTDLQETISGYFCHDCEDDYNGEKFISNDDIDEMPWKYLDDYEHDESPWDYDPSDEDY